MPMKERAKTSVPRRETPPPLVVPIDTTIRQERENWCWAACIQVVLKSRGIRHTQCKLANSVPRLGGACCGSRPPEACDDGLADQEITELFRSVGVTTVTPSGSLSAEILNTALDAGRPVAIAFDWGHMCLVYGRQNGRYLMYDPLEPSSGTLSLTGIRNYGQGTG